MSIKPEDGDDVANGLCSGCRTAPAAADLAPPPGVSAAHAATSNSPTPATPAALAAPARPRAFNAADLALIRRVGAIMAPPQLLSVLNERLVADVGSHVTRYSLAQLQDAIAQAHGQASAQRFTRDWPSLRRLLTRARREGVLAQIDEQVINDFAVVFQLTTKQTLELKDIVLPATQEA